MSSRDRFLAPFHLFAAALFCLFGVGCRFSSYLSSSFCRALLLFFPCSFTSFLGFSVLVFGRSLTSSVTLHFSFLLSVISSLSHMVPFSTSFSFVSVVLLCLLIGWCFLLGGFPRCASSWLSCGCSFVSFLASFLPVPLVLGFSSWSLGALLPRSNLRFPLRRAHPLGRGSYLLGFSELLLLPCHAHAFLVPLRWSFSASLLLFLLSGSPLPVGLFFSGVRHPPLPSEVSVLVPSSSFCGFSYGCLAWSVVYSLLRFHFLPAVPPWCCFGRLPLLRFPSSSCLGWVLFLCVSSP